MGQIIEYIKMALMNIKSNKGRSFLTMLGIIIGISSVIMIISIGNGIKGQVSGELNDFAGGQIYIMTDSKANDVGVTFNESDFDAILEKVDHVKGVTPSYYGRGTAKGPKGSFDADISGGTVGLEYSSKDPIIDGRYFNSSEYYSGSMVCVMTESGAMQLFGTTDVVGLTVEATLYGTSQEVTIVGIRQDNASKMIAMMSGASSVVLEMPITAFSGGYGFYAEDFDGFYIISESAEYASDVAKASINLLEGRHNVRGKGIIQVQNFSDSLAQINSVLGYITIFVVFVAAISLLVGGIGVMNIMLVSVTERTREIGIRKALGARTSSILMQFLSESAIITLLGGVIGIVIGTGGAFIICSVIGFKPVVKVSTILIATVFSSGVGIFFGIYPAKKAAKLSPIEALRHE